MSRASHGRRESTSRLFVVFAIVTLIPVLLLGAVLAASYRTEANRRGLAQGRSEAVLMAETAVQPLLDGRPLSQPFSKNELHDIEQLATQAVLHQNVLRFRLRALSGNVVFSDDGSGFHQAVEDEALEAAGGTTVARITHLNSDHVDSGRIGPEAVEVYLPLQAGSPSRRVGVMEVYLPYAPIRADLTSGLNTLYRNLVLGLALLYVALFGISFSAGRRLRRQVKLNAYLAEHDSLTDLPNRSLFHRRIEAVLESGKRHDHRTTIAIIDLDRFKEVNDTLGHHNGDRLLTALSQRMASHLRGRDALARLGGDEFGVLLSNLSEPEEVLLRLRSVIQREIEISGLPLSIEASIGFVVAPDDGADVDELLQLADVAMYTAKRKHAGVLHYDPTQNNYSASNLALVAELRHAIASDELVLHYQPKVGLPDQSTHAVEALVRWQHPTHGMLYPDRFIPLAEQTDLIDELTSWVLREALSDIAHLEAAAGSLSVAVNVSARNLGRSGFSDQVSRALAEAGVQPGRLIIEVTETALMTDPVRAALVLGEISALGVQISIDDFGTGQTSLGYLSSLPISELKIDKSFIADMADNADHGAIVRSIVELGHNLTFSVVGEGVETDIILECLEATGCDIAQGYLFARPMPKNQLAEWLRNTHVPTS